MTTVNFTGFGFTVNSASTVLVCKVFFQGVSPILQVIHLQSLQPGILKHRVSRTSSGGIELAGRCGAESCFDPLQLKDGLRKLIPRTLSSGGNMIESVVL